MRETILELARAICAPTEAEEPLLEALASAAEAELAGRLGTEVSPADCGDAFPCAAALLTAAGLLACRTGGEAEQFTVGDVSLRTGSGGQYHAGNPAQTGQCLIRSDRFGRDAFFHVYHVSDGGLGQDHFINTKSPAG